MYDNNKCPTPLQVEHWGKLPSLQFSSDSVKKYRNGMHHNWSENVESLRKK
jgi:hypothetical protein